MRISSEVQCHVESHWYDELVDVWVFYRMPGKNIFIGLDGETIEETIEGGELPTKPTMQVHRNMLKAIVTKASKIIPPSEATVEHLRDAIAVRDRLLGIVERAK